MFFVFVLGLALGSDIGPKKNDIVRTRDNAMRVGWDILFSHETIENVVISPLSIIGAMYMLAAGTAGPTQYEILTALDYRDVREEYTPFRAYSALVNGLQNEDSESYTLQLANGAFHQRILPNGVFGKDALEKYSGVLLQDFMRDLINIKEVDFQESPTEATHDINNWINATTRGKIPELFKEPLEPETLMVLVSSLYFRGSWLNKFEIDNGDLCWQSNVKQILNAKCNEDVVFMSQTSSFRTHSTDDGQFGVIEIPMKERNNDGSHNRFTMLVWMSDKFINDDEENDRVLREFIRDNYPTIRGKLTPKRMKLSIPKFSLDVQVDLVEQMKALGIQTVFSSGNFTPMFGASAPDCKVSKIKHAVKLDVDERGVEGAATTAIQISFRSGFDPKRFDVVRPFYFTISNRCWDDKNDAPVKRCAHENMPIFMGKVVDPAV